MHYTHTVDFELDCKLEYALCYSNYELYDIKDILEDINGYIDDGMAFIMDIGGYVFTEFGVPYRYISMYVEPAEEFSLQHALKSLDNYALTFVNITQDCNIAGGEDEIYNSEADISEYVTNEFKKQLVELFL